MCNMYTEDTDSEGVNFIIYLEVNYISPLKGELFLTIIKTNFLLVFGKLFT